MLHDLRPQKTRGGLQLLMVTTQRQLVSRGTWGTHELNQFDLNPSLYYWLDGIVMTVLILLFTCWMWHSTTPNSRRAFTTRLGTAHITITILLLTLITHTNATDPNQRSDYDELKDMKIWNGKPYHDFLITWFAALCAALGAIVQDGNTLLQCAEGEDSDRNTGDANHNQHLLRRARLGACICKYIKTGTSLYLRLTNADSSRQPYFGGNGVLMFRYIKHIGHLPRTPEQEERIREMWEHATMAKVGIQYTDTAIFDWVDWLITTNHKYRLGKSSTQLRKKFLEGFPSSFDVVLTAERLTKPNGMYLFPTTYPTHHPKAGDPDPRANQPSIELAADSLYPEWSRRIGKDIKPLPKGMVHRARAAVSEVLAEVSDSGGDADQTNTDEPDTVHDDDDDCAPDSDDSDTDAALAIASRKIGPDDICGACGGRGHWSKVGGKSCLTIVLGNRVPKHELMQTKYPNGLSFPNLDSKSRDSKSAHRLESKGSSSRSYRPRSKSPRRPHPKGKGKFRSKFQPKRSAKSVETANTKESSEDEAESKSESSDSEGEAGKLVASMAIDYKHIITPPPSPPGSPITVSDWSPEKDGCFGALP